MDNSVCLRCNQRLMGEICFTSDTHLGHSNIAGPNSKWENGYRTFNSVKEMDDTIIKNINDMVGENDILYHLGDFSFGPVTKYRNRIKCKNIHLIKGNHDRFRNLDKSLFLTINSALDVKIKGRNFYLHHYACRVWNRSHHRCIHLYGHSHGSIDDNWGLSMDVGIDNAYKLFGEYRPFTEKEILDIMGNRDILILDHHDKR